MGFFSFKTADTKESIPCEYASNDIPNYGRTVYLLQPNGQPPIAEHKYEGYGVFGGQDAYEWLAKTNFGDSSENARHLAINAHCGSYYYDPKKDMNYICRLDLSPAILAKTIGVSESNTEAFDTYNSVLDDGKTPNAKVESGEWERKSINLKYPLKFSFNPNAVYESLPASESCDYQGYFYE